MEANKIPIYSEMEGTNCSDEVRPSSSGSFGSTVTNMTHTIPFSNCYYNNSLAIRQEIQRFESVHPSIYAIYDLLEAIGSTDLQLLALQMREHIVCIEDSFVNSQEWTISRTVPDLRLGVVGTISSGKSALVHRYLTGSYLQDESPEGGRFKKEVTIDGQSHLLLIRDEGGPPEMQLSCWVDAVLFVFSLENESSFNTIYNYYLKMFHLRPNYDIPIFLIGTQDAISETNPRVIDESRARKLCSELKHCTYYETCATYGLNVEKVFQDVCHQIVMMRNLENSPNQGNNSRPSTPNNVGIYRSIANIGNVQQGQLLTNQTSTPLGNITNNKYRQPNSPLSPVPIGNNYDSSTISEQSPNHSIVELNSKTINNMTPLKANAMPTLSANNTPQTNNLIKPVIAVKPKLSSPPVVLTCSNVNTFVPIAPKRSESIKLSNENNQFKVPMAEKEPPKDQTTPAHTPSSTRKNRRKSNLFTPLSGKNKNLDEKFKNGEVGVGRTIPIKQGYLYKKSKKTLNKDWKKKYVTLTSDGYLTYHRTLHDYMDDSNGKSIPLKHTTVKIPGQKPRCGRASIAFNANNFEPDSMQTQVAKMIPITNPKIDPNNVKKRSRKLKNIGTKNNDNGEESDMNEFMIVSLENKQWHFNANSNDEREEWVSAIEQQILSSLENSQIDKSKFHNVSSADANAIHSIRTVPGNKYCVDCDAPNPDWASLNLGALICIECSGIHRKLGTHISKVRSLTLDVWPSSHVSVMLGLGNTACNKIWEFNLNAKLKPGPSTNYEEKEKYIRAKYEAKKFLAPLSDESIPMDQQIVDCVQAMDIKQLALVLAHISMNKTDLAMVFGREKKTPLHLAASRGCLEITQLLIWNNMDEKAVDADGRTALFYARISGHKEIEELLIQNGCHSTNQEISSMKGANTMTGSNNNNNIDSRSIVRRHESIPLNVRQIEMFNKLPASII
ncbi:hypothetical protein RDWZM_003077 [Blomia tropicalis]|uniref:Centaurin-gamma-1A n=1 Tax=Blomia tropicalis TaxID=40697 RepID=A0A9Q0MHJ1_BLOTA|nr:hypothetical protein RDWZM_003077 [Blomia tropicalis]